MPIYTLWEMLSGAELVFADEDAQILIMWNTSQTFNVYTPDGADFAEVTAFMISEPTFAQDAKYVAKEWFEANYLSN